MPSARVHLREQMALPETAACSTDAEKGGEVSAETCVSTSTSTSAADTSSAPLDSIPSLEVDYDAVDAEDPQIGWIRTFAVFGFSERNPADPRYRALAKLQAVADDHGVGDLNFFDALRGVTVYAALCDRRAKEKLLEENSKQSETSGNDNTLKKGITSQISLDKLERFLGFMGQRNRAEVHIGTCSSTQSSEDEDSSTSRNPSLMSSSKSLLLSENGNTMSRRIATVTPDHARLLFHMMRHAESIYGMPITLGSAPLTSLAQGSHRRIVSKMTGLVATDIVHKSFTAETFTPAHYVAVDRAINAVVVCIRGTANFIDSLTDIAATQDPITVRKTMGSSHSFVKGYGHSGVLRSARNLFAKIRGPTLNALRDNRGYELLITGHSLGAAIASVLSLIMRDDCNFPRATAVCIAPLPCLSLELAEETVLTAITVVNGPDIVPRLSIPVLLPLVATARYTADLSPSRKVFSSLGLHGVAVPWKELVQESTERAAQMSVKHEGRQLYLPGAVFQMVYVDEVHRRDIFRHIVHGNRKVQLVPVHRNDFVQVRGRERGMFVSHATFSYRAALKALLKNMQVEPFQKVRNPKAAVQSLKAKGLAHRRAKSADSEQEQEVFDGIAKFIDFLYAEDSIEKHDNDEQQLNS